MRFDKVRKEKTAFMLTPSLKDLMGYYCKTNVENVKTSDCLFYLTITWGAAASTASVAIIVNRVNVIRQSLSKTIAANFQSPSIAADSSSSRILSVITLISFSIRLSSLGTPEG